MTMDKTYKLCYIDDRWAFFTTNDIEKQWGDDWNDAPYEYNAGAPYEYRDYMDCEPYKIDRVVFDGDFETPDSYVNQYSTYSVQDINRGVVPWLQTDRYGAADKRIKIYAGCTFPEFVALVEEAGGRVWVARER